MHREQLLVELVDDDGTATGTSVTVADAHRPPGLLHRAFSVVVLDPSDRVLLQRRASAKTRFPGLWANTCCGHPAPGVEVATAARRRLEEEMGLSGIDLAPVGSFVYQAADARSTAVEHEFDEVLVGRVPTGIEPRPDPSEVAAWRWVSAAELRAELSEPSRAAQTYVPWLARALELAVPAHRPAEDVGEADDRRRRRNS